MAHQVFISYASEDVDVARKVAAALNARGVTSWMAPDDIPPGEDYPGAIVRAITQAEAFVLLFTESSNTSHNVLKEVELAAQRKRRIIPLRLQDMPPSDSLAYFVSTPQWVDVFGSDPEGRIDELAASLASMLQAGADPKPGARRDPRRRGAAPTRRASAPPRQGSRGMGPARVVLLGLLVLAAGGILLWMTKGRRTDDDGDPTPTTTAAAGDEKDEPAPTPDPVPAPPKPTPPEAAGPELPSKPGRVELTVMAPENGAFLDDREVRVRGTFAGPLPEGSLWVGSEPARVEGRSFEATIKANEDGPLTFEVRCSGDRVVAESVRREVIIDTRAPRLELLSPPPDVEVVSSPELVVHGRLVEANPSELRVDGVLIALDADGAFEHSWTLTADRPRILVFEAEDKAGNRMLPLERRFRYERTRVAIRLVAPMAGALLGTEVVEVTGRVEGGKGRRKMLVNGETAYTRDDGSFSHALRPPKDGPFDVMVEIEDTAHVGDRVTRRVVVDSTPPTLDVTSPRTQSMAAGSHIVVLNGRVADPHLDQLSLNDEPIVFDADGTFSWPVFVADGVQTSLSLEAVDAIGNRSSRAYRIKGPSAQGSARGVMKFHDTWESARRLAQRTGQLVFTCVSRYKPP